MSCITEAVCQLKAMSQFMDKAVLGEDIILKSKGQQRYSYCYIADAVSGLLKLLLDGQDGEKQWGRDCKDLPSFIIKRLPVRLTFDNNYFNALYQGIPVGGYTKMVANLLDGIEVRLNMDYLDNKAELDALADKVVYTGAIDAYFDYKLGTLE